MLRPFSLALMFGMGFALPAMADCDDPQNQVEMNQCAFAAFETADAELNTVYQQLIGRIDKRYVASLRAAQRAWVPFRDAQCDFESMGWEGGSGRPMIQSGCLRRVTEERTLLLRALLTCDPETSEGDIECPPKP